MADAPHPLTALIRSQLQEAADPAKADLMQAYMKTDQPFYGVQAGPRRKLFKAAVRHHKDLSRKDYERIIFELWHGTHREQMYQALEVAAHFQAYRDKASWSTYEKLVKTATWWDTLDWIAAGLVGPLVLEHREFEGKLLQWSRSKNLWVRRASLLAHLKHKAHTNLKLLADTILTLSPEHEFFTRKAIGWALREYSKTDPTWVASFVKIHQDALSGLSKREALKHIQRTTKERA